MKKLTWNSTLKKPRSWHLVPSLHSIEKGQKWKRWQILFSWAPKSLWTLTKSYDKCRQHIKNQKHHFANKGLYSQSYSLFSSHMHMWELDHKEGWVPKNWCFLIVVLEKTLESPLNSKEIKPVHPKGIQTWIFIGRTVAEVPILWPPDAKSRLIGKKLVAGKDWRQ